MPQRPFKQVDVFSRVPFKGNPLAVILDGTGLDTVQMQTIARWTQLSETTFVLPPPVPEADYAVRIFTTEQEFRFAGHPTLGTAHALLEAGLQPRTSGRLIQHCGVGLVTVDIGVDGRLAFQAPPAQLDLFDETFHPLLARALGSTSWHGQSPATRIEMGNTWLAVGLANVDDCLQLKPNAAVMEELLALAGLHGVVVYAFHAAGGPADLEVRVFVVEQGTLLEDPATGSANGCVAWLLEAQGHMGEANGRPNYVARQGTQIHRAAELYVDYRARVPWIGGYCTTLIQGVIDASAARRSTADR